MRNAFGIENHGEISKKDPAAMLKMAMEPGKKIAAQGSGKGAQVKSQLDAVGAATGRKIPGVSTVHPRPIGGAPVAPQSSFKEKAALKFKPIKDWTKDNPWKTAGIAGGTSAVGGAGAAYGAKKR